MIRTLVQADIHAALELSSAAGWNQTAEDWQMLLELQADGCFGIHSDGRLAATTTLVTYGRRLAWLGMVLTLPAFRNRGFAARLVAHALSFADQLGVETVKLDATDQGQPIYERYGFRAEDAVERWQGSPVLSAGVCNGAPFDESAMHLDCNAFGADRSHALRLLAARGWACGSERGYVMARPGSRAAYLGPCVAQTGDAAEALIRRALSGNTGPWFWDLLPANAAAVRIANELGFAPVRRLVRMYRGRELRAQNEMIYALAGFELG